LGLPMASFSLTRMGGIGNLKGFFSFVATAGDGGVIGKEGCV
jgi:hypothetical protein